MKKMQPHSKICKMARNANVQKIIIILRLHNEPPGLSFVVFRGGEVPTCWGGGQRDKGTEGKTNNRREDQEETRQSECMDTKQRNQERGRGVGRKKKRKNEELNISVRPRLRVIRSLRAESNRGKTRNRIRITEEAGTKSNALFDKLADKLGGQFRLLNTQIQCQLPLRWGFLFDLSSSLSQAQEADAAGNEDENSTEEGVFRNVQMPRAFHRRGRGS